MPQVTRKVSKATSSPSALGELNSGILNASFQADKNVGTALRQAGHVAGGISSGLARNYQESKLKVANLQQDREEHEARLAVTNWYDENQQEIEGVDDPDQIQKNFKARYDQFTKDYYPKINNKNAQISIPRYFELKGEQFGLKALKAYEKREVQAKILETPNRIEEFAQNRAAVAGEPLPNATYASNQIAEKQYFDMLLRDGVYTAPAINKLKNDIDKLEVAVIENKNLGVAKLDGEMQYQEALASGDNHEEALTKSLAAIDAHMGTIGKTNVEFLRNNQVQDAKIFQEGQESRREEEQRNISSEFLEESQKTDRTPGEDQLFIKKLRIARAQEDITAEQMKMYEALMIPSGHIITADSASAKVIRITRQVTDGLMGETEAMTKIAALQITDEDRQKANKDIMEKTDSTEATMMTRASRSMRNIIMVNDFGQTVSDETHQIAYDEAEIELDRWMKDFREKNKRLPTTFELNSESASIAQNKIGIEEINVFNPDFNREYPGPGEVTKKNRDEKKNSFFKTVIQVRREKGDAAAREYYNTWRHKFNN